MVSWKQLVQPPSGALPGNLITKVGIGIIAVLLVGLVLSQSGGDPASDETTADPEVVEEGLVGRLRSRLTQLEDRRRFEEDDRVRRTAAASALTPTAPLELEPDGTALEDAAEAVPTDREVELRERLRLEAIERRTRSLRAPSVVQTFRDGLREPEAAAVASAARVHREATPAAGGPPRREEAVDAPPPDPAAVADRMQAANAALLEGLAGGSAPPAPAERTVPGVTGPPVGPTADPAVVKVPADPTGWERIYEGAVLSAVLVTQLSGKFTGPVLAQVAIPLYSTDRQRILVPRGARLLGTAQAVRYQDQSRLAVGFHRLVWPDGRWVDLAFHGLNAIGESALADQVDRHYASMFAAAGAVGLLAGLTLQGSDPYAGGAAGFRAAAGQGFGQSATQILGRFLNRLPTVTIRAGHRLRVWVTSDFLLPRPEPHPERMYR